MLHLSTFWHPSRQLLHIARAGDGCAELVQTERLEILHRVKYELAKMAGHRPRRCSRRARREVQRPGSSPEFDKRIGDRISDQ